MILGKKVDSPHLLASMVRRLFCWDAVDHRLDFCIVLKGEFPCYYFASGRMLTRLK